MELSIIIVSWNVKTALEQCLRSIQQHLSNQSYEVVVVDNASHDGSADLVEKDFPWVKLIRNTTNQGFGKANNQGLQIAQGTYMLFLNDDASVTDAGVYKGIDYLQNHKKVGLLGPHLLNPDGSTQVSVRRFPTWKDQVFYLLKLHLVFPRAHVLQTYLCQDFDYSKDQTVDQVMGAAMLTRTDIVKNLLGFDPRYPNWFEEVDLCRRIQVQGYEVRYVPTFQIVHIKGASFGQQKPIFLQRMYNYSMRQYFKKWEGWWALALITLAQPISLFLAGVVQVVNQAGIKVKKLKPKDV